MLRSQCVRIASQRIRSTHVVKAAFSTVTTRSLGKQVAEALGQAQPSFNLHGRDVKILHSPKDFYSNLISMIQRAKRRIVLSSLYIGTAEKELLQSLHTALQQNPQLTLDLHLDLLRSTRPESPSTAEFLLPLIKSFGEDRVRVHLFRTPKLKGLTARLVPRRFDEGWGTWHAKLYAVDDEIMISGANMNSSYFTNRQDRYLHFSNQPDLTAYAVDFAQTMVPFTHRLAPKAGEEGAYQAEWRNAESGPTAFESAAKQALQDLQSKWRTSARTQTSGDTSIFPIIQSGVLGIREEEKAIGTLFDAIEELPSTSGRTTVDLTSGYFGLYSPYKARILAAPNDIQWRIVAASPKANGFYGSKGISGRLPEAYTWLERRFWQAASKAGKIRGTNNVVELNEWQRQGWTYHAKGIWVRVGETEGPTVSLFGSTNLNSRSANLDTELSFMMVTSSDELSQGLGREVDGIREHASEVDGETWKQEARRVRLTTMGMAQVVSGML